MITDVNPFVYSRPIAPDQIVDRDEETQLLLKNAVGGHYVRLYAPRKYGKTSLLQRALADGERQEGLVPVLVDDRAGVVVVIQGRPTTIMDFVIDGGLITAIRSLSDPTRIAGIDLTHVIS